jgi:hypothetical protein
MPNDFMLEPSDIEPERPERARPVRIVGTGIAPTAAVPPSRQRGPDAPPVYAPCSICSAMVVAGITTTGQRVAVEPGRRTYTIVWHTQAALPTLQESRACPLHVCGPPLLNNERLSA